MVIKSETQSLNIFDTWDFARGSCLKILRHIQRIANPFSYSVSLQVSNSIK